MKKNLLLIVLAFISTNGCKNVELQNQWADNPVIVDGDYADWEDIPIQYLEETNVMIGSLNDDNNLYIMFRFNDYTLARKIQRFGATIWVNEDGKKNKDYGIRYAGSVGLLQEPISDRDPSENMPEERMARMQKMMASRPEPGTITVISKDEETSLPENNQDGPSAGSAKHNGIFCYEYRIPLPLNIKLKDKISLGLEVGGMNPADFNQMREQRSGMRGGGGRPGGRMGGPGRGMGDGMGRLGGGKGGRGSGGTGMARGKMFEKQEIWMKVVLVDKANGTDGKG